MDPSSIQKINYRGDYKYSPQEEDYADCPECVDVGRDPIEYFAWDDKTDEQVKITADEYYHPEKYPDKPWTDKDQCLLSLERCPRCDGEGQIPFRKWNDEYGDPDEYDD